jgi:hypothetical protein
MTRTFFSESASIIRPVMVVLPEPVPPQIPMISGLLSSGRIASASQVRKAAYELIRRGPYLFLCFACFFSSITACAAARRAIGTQKGVALT